MVQNEYKSVIDDITNDRVAFDVQTHGTDQGLLEAMAAGIYKSFKCIPGQLLTASLIELGSKSLCEMMGEEDCYTPGDYEATVLKLISQKVGIHVFHQDLLTKRIIDVCLETNLYDTIERRNRIGAKGRSFITPEDLNAAVASRIDILGMLEPWEVDLISDDALTSAIRNDRTQGMVLENAGRRDILIKEISHGLWCNNQTITKSGEVQMTGIARPASLRDAISERMKIDDRNVHDILYYDCFAAGFPVESFKSLVRSKARQDWIIGIFPAQELIRVFKDDFRMKGKILEHELGM